MYLIACVSGSVRNCSALLGTDLIDGQCTSRLVLGALVLKVCLLGRVALSPSRRIWPHLAAQSSLASPGVMGGKPLPRSPLPGTPHSNLGEGPGRRSALPAPMAPRPLAGPSTQSLHVWWRAMTLGRVG